MVACLSTGKSPPSSSTPSSSSVASRSIVPSATCRPYRMESMLLRTEATYDTSVTLPCQWSTCPPTKTTSPVVLRVSTWDLTWSSPVVLKPASSGADQTGHVESQTVVSGGGSVGESHA